MVSFRCGCGREVALALAGIDPGKADLFYSPRGQGLAPRGVELAKSTYDIGEATDKFCRFVLSELNLTDSHRAGLRAAGWSDEAIDAAGYRSWVTVSAARAVGRIQDVYPPAVLRAIPGIVEKEGPNRTTQFSVRHLPSGLVIPSRLDGAITSLRLRRDAVSDTGGKYLYLSGGNDENRITMQPHIPASLPLGCMDTVRIVEGEKKADYACWKSPSIPTISFPGVDSWPVVLPWLASRGVKTVHVAFDADADSNPAVARQLVCCVRGLAGLGYAVVLETWPAFRGKGFDDLLAGGHSPDAFAGSEAEAEALSMAERAGVKEEEIAKAANANIPPEKLEAPPTRQVSVSTPPFPRPAPPKVEKDKEGKKKAPDAALDLMHEMGMVGLLGPDGTTYLSWEDRGKLETVSSGSQQFVLRFMAAFREAMGETIPAEAIKVAALTRVGQCMASGEDEPIELRLARRGGTLYVDLADRDRRVIEIDADGWRLSTGCRVRFLRKDGMSAMPMPVVGGSLDWLRPYVNTDDVGYRLLLGWLVQAYHPTGPYFHLLLKGSAGSAKSTVTRIMKMLTDPISGELTNFPPTERDLMISALNSRVLGFDNLVKIDADMSDALCRLATGGGLRVRKLFSDSDEVFLQAKRPVIVNGIPDIVTAGDLADRVVSIELQRINPKTRRGEEGLLQSLADDLPGILGALFDAVSMAMRDRGKIELKRPPRMIDAAQFIEAAEPALGFSRGEWGDAYWEMRGDMDLTVIDADPVAGAIRKLVEMDDIDDRTGEDLLEALKGVGHVDKSWPGSARALASRLKALTPTLSQFGIEVSNIRVGAGNDKKRMWRVTKKST